MNSLIWWPSPATRLSLIISSKSTMKHTLRYMILLPLILAACGRSQLPNAISAQARQGPVKAPAVPADGATPETMPTALYVPPEHAEKIDAPTLPRGGLGQFKLETNRAPEERPVLHINSPIVDQQTGQPVKATVYITENIDKPQDKVDAVMLDVDRIEVGFDQSMAGSWLVVVAPGYEVWAQRIDFKIEYSRVFEGQVELVRMGV